MIEGLDREAIASELPEDAEVWFIIDTTRPDVYILSPDFIHEEVLWLFLKKEDAEHFAYLAMQLAPAFKDKKVIIESEKLNEIRKNVEHKIHWEILPPNETIKFFKEYEEQMPKYYGL